MIKKQNHIKKFNFLIKFELFFPPRLPPDFGHYHLEFFTYKEIVLKKIFLQTFFNLKGWVENGKKVVEYFFKKPIIYRSKLL